MSEFLPEEFVRRERERCIRPPEGFAGRVVERLPSSRTSEPVWDYIPGFARPLMVGVVTALLLIVVGFKVFHPDPPMTGIIDAYLGVDSTPAENWLYRDAEPPVGHDLLLEISLAEEL